MTEQTYEGWAIVELMGHRQRGGYVKDVEMFGGKLLRVDIPVAADTTVTEFYGCTAIYALRPCSEEIVRDHVSKSYGGDPRPVRPVEYRLEAPRAQDQHDEDEFDGGDR